MRLNHNIFSLKILSSYKQSLAKGSNSMRKISSGLDINLSKDNANKIASNEKLKIQILCNSAVKKNIQDTSSMLQTFDGSMQQINNNLSRLKELSSKAANGTLQEEDRKVIQDEVDKIMEDIDYLANETQFNGIKLLNADRGMIKSKVGIQEGQDMEIPTYNFTCKELFKEMPKGLDVINLPSMSISAIESAYDKVSKASSVYGALESRLDGTGESIDGFNESLQTIQSRIGDADIAQEILKNSESNILVNSSLALMVQSNKLPQDALKIISNV